jgi:predicted esterase
VHDAMDEGELEKINRDLTRDLAQSWLESSNGGHAITGTMTVFARSHFDHSRMQF